MPFRITAALLSCLLLLGSTTAVASSQNDAGAPRVVRRRPAPLTDAGPSPLAATSNHASLARVKASSEGGSSSRLRGAALAKGYGKAGLRDLLVEEEWAVEVDFGGQTVLLILDTGSSDTWVAQTGFDCVSKKLKPKTEASCKFGPLYNGTFTGGTIKNQNFNITYGDGEFLTGDMGYTNVTVGGITVKDQEVALVNKAFWRGDSRTSGLIGFAYSALTSAFIGTDPTLDNFNKTGNATGDQTLYSPVVTSMISQGLLGAPLFSLALQRSKKESSDSFGGYVALGGLPPISFDPVFTSTPLEIHEFYEYPPLEKTMRGFYTITPDAYVYKNSAGVLTNHSTTIPGIVDSGTTLLYLPPAAMAGYIASFDPPAVPGPGGEAYFYPCNATAPYLGMNIAGTTFEISSADIIVPGTGYTNKTTGVDYCLVGVFSGGEGPADFPIFGDVFLKNVVAVFDIGASLIRFAQHTY